MHHTHIWQEGKYFDLWSLAHFLAGVVFTGWLLKFDINIWILLGAFTVLAILWEFFEIWRGVDEHKINRVLDVVKGMLGWLVVYLTVRDGNGFNTIVLVVITVVWVALEAHGYYSYKKRGKV